MESSNNNAEPKKNELDHQVNEPVMQSQEEVVVFDEVERVDEQESDSAMTTSPNDGDASSLPAPPATTTTPSSSETSTAQRILSERFQSWKQQATEQASSSRFFSRMVDTYNSTGARTTNWKVPSVNLNTPTPDQPVEIPSDDEEKEESCEQPNDGENDDHSTNDEADDQDDMQSAQAMRAEKLRVWSQTISESVSQQVSTFRGRYSESMTGKDSESDDDGDDYNETGRYTITLGRGMLGVNLKSTFAINNGVYVDYIVENGTGYRQGVSVGDHVVAVGDSYEPIQNGTVISVPTAIAQAPRPVEITLAHYELVPPSNEDDSCAVTPILNHIDVAVALLNCGEMEAFAELKVPDAMEGGCLSALLEPYSLEFPNQSLLLPFAQRRCFPQDFSHGSLAVALKNAALLILADPRRTVFLTEHFAEVELQHNLVLLAVELTMALELERDWKSCMKQVVREVASKYFLPTPVVKARGASFDSQDAPNDAVDNEESNHSTSSFQAPLLDVHTEFTESELQKLDKSLDGDVCTAFGDLYGAVLEKIDMKSFLESDAAARMRGFMRSTVPYRNVTATECWKNTNYLQYCLAYWMQTGQTEQLCCAVQRWRKESMDVSRSDPTDQVLYEYARNGHVEFKMSLYYEQMLDPNHDIEDLWKTATFPDIWSVHRQSVVEEHLDAEKESVFNAEMACVFTSESDAIVGCSFDPCTLDDLPAAGLLQRYFVQEHQQPLSVVNFWLPRECMHGVALIVCSVPSGTDEDTSSTSQNQNGAEPSDSVALTNIGLALLSSQNVIFAMRETILRFVEKMGKGIVFDTLHKLVSNSTGDEEIELRSLLDPFWSEASNPWLDRPLESQKDAFLQVAGDQLLTCLTPIPLALFVLLAMLEQKIVITSSRRSVLHSTTTALLELLRPLSWCHLMVPIVPDSQMAGDLLEYPAPFLLGWHTPPKSDFLELLRDLPESVTLVDLDVGRVICGITSESSLRSSVLALAQRLGTEWAEKAYPDTWLCDHPIGKQEFSQRPFVAVSTECHGFIENLLSNIPTCCYEVNGTVHLDEEQFTRKASRFDGEIIRSFLRSQAINAYISSLDPKRMAFSLSQY